MDADHCRCQAEHYRALARQMTDLNDKATLFGLAAYWARLAKEAEREVGAAGKQGAMEEAQEIGSPPYQGQRHPTSAPSQGQRDVVTCARSRHELGPETRSAFGISFTAARLISS